VSDSVGFDRAAEYYDRTRGFSPEAFDALMPILVRELEGRDPFLEIGVGTGLLSLPLSERGVRPVGLDLARSMLDKLVEKASGSLPFPLVQADATRLPFRDRSFGSAVFRHVLHLIPDWRTAVEELVRVLAPGAYLLTLEGAFKETWWSIVDRFLSEAGGIAFGVGMHPGDQIVLDRLLAGHGAEVRIVGSIPDRREETIGDFLDQMEAGMHSWTWRVEEDVRRRAVARTRAWAAERFGSLDRWLAPEHQLEVRRYELPEAAPGS